MPPFFPRKTAVNTQQPSFVRIRAQLHERGFGGMQIRNAPAAIRDNFPIMIAVIQTTPRALQYASERLRKYPSLNLLALSGVQSFEDVLVHTHTDLLDNRAFIMRVIGDYGASKHGLIMKYASERLCGDREVIAAAIVRNGSHNLHFASEELRGNLAIATLAMQQDGLFPFDALTEELRGNRDFAMEAVRSNARHLKYLPEHLRADREVVRAALECDEAVPEILGYISEDLQRDPALAREILACGGGYGIQGCSGDLLADKEFIMNAIKWGGASAFRYASAELRGDREVALAAARSAVEDEDRDEQDEVLEHVSEELRGDYEIVELTVQVRGLDLEYASEELRDEPRIVFLAVRNNYGALRFATGPRCADPMFRLSALSANEDVAELSKGGYSRFPEALDVSYDVAQAFRMAHHVVRSRKVMVRVFN